MFCPRCGSRNDEDARFCLKCGTPLAMFIKPETPVYTTPARPITPVPYTATPKAIGTAIAAIVAVIMLFPPWLCSDWGLTLNYFDLCSSSGDSGTMALVGLIAYGILAVVSVITGFIGTKTGFGIAAGTLGIFMGAIMFIVEGTVGYGVYLFLVANFLLIIMSTLEK